MSTSDTDSVMTNYHYGQCTANTKAGLRCRIGSEPGSDLCHVHLGGTSRPERPDPPWPALLRSGRIVNQEIQEIPTRFPEWPAHQQPRYADYIVSDVWERKRDAVKNAHKALGTLFCVACRTTERLELHHRTYVRLGHETLDDLCLLCRACHQIQYSLTKEWAYDEETSLQAVIEIRAAHG
jgi:hypothetical protein